MLRLAICFIFRSTPFMSIENHREKTNSLVVVKILVRPFHLYSKPLRFIEIFQNFLCTKKISRCIVTRYQNTYSKQNSRLTFIIFFLSINDIDDKVAWFSICIYHYSLSIRVLCKLEIKTFSSFSHFAYNGYTQYQKIFILDFKLIFHDLLVCLYCQIRKRFLSF